MLNKISKFIVIFFISMSSINNVFSNENQINNYWCNKNDGEIQYRTKYGTYVDCLTSIYAVEVEYDYNWKEGIGQSLHYAEATGKKPAILLIKRNKSTKNYESELKSTIDFFNLPITLFSIQETLEYE